MEIINNLNDESWKLKHISWIQDVNWKHIKKVMDTFQTSYVRSIYALCLEGNKFKFNKKITREHKKSFYCLC